MKVCHEPPTTSTGNCDNLQLFGHQPQIFTGQKKSILDLLLKNRGKWMPSYALAEHALQYSATVKELQTAGYTIENRTKKVNGQVHGEFQLVACPSEPEGSR